MAKNGFMFMIDDQEEILAAVKRETFTFKSASERRRDNKEAVLAVVRNNGWPLRYASKRLQNDKEVVLAAVRNDGIPFCFSLPRLKDNTEVVLADCRKSKLSLNFASRKLRSDKEFIKELKISDVDVFKCCHCSIRKHKDIYLPALKKDPTLCKRFSLNVLLKLDFSSLTKKNREVIYEAYKRRSKEKDLFLLAKAKQHFLS